MSGPEKLATEADTDYCDLDEPSDEVDYADCYRCKFRKKPKTILLANDVKKEVEPLQKWKEIAGIVGGGLIVIVNK